MRLTRSTSTVILVSALMGIASAQTQGPSSSQVPYLLPLAPGVRTVSILTVGDTLNTGDASYRLVGIPDGMGASVSGPDRFELLVNHEISGGAGVVRAHGENGAFVSKWAIRRSDLTVLRGSDLIRHVNFSTGTAQLLRLCSGDLPNSNAFFPGLGSAAPRIFMSGEEAGIDGRAFAHVASGPEAGESYELPALGNLSFENIVARPYGSANTVAALLDDSTPGQVYFYIGTKQATGNAITRAGLGAGSLYGIRIPGVPLEDRTTGISGATRFELANLGDVSAKTGTEIQADSVAAGVTEFLRPEDGVWNPRNPRNFFFVTTDRFQNATQEGRSRLWRLRFDSLAQPELGGTIEMLLNGTEGQQMFDNITVDGRGNLLLQEDIGNQDPLGRIWQFSPETHQLKLIAEHNPVFFAPGAPNFLTRDEESSGIIDASAILGAGWFLLNVQAHYSIPGELVEGGQILALFNPDSL